MKTDKNDRYIKKREKPVTTTPTLIAAAAEAARLNRFSQKKRSNQVTKERTIFTNNK